MATSSLKLVTVLAGLTISGALYAAEPAAKIDVKEAATIDKLVANQPDGTPARQLDSDKPMTINFSDFVKDGAGCGMPNLDTSAK